MQISKRDGAFIAAIIALLGFLLMRPGDKKASPIPYNDKHRQYYESIHTDGSRQEVEKRCTACHSATTTPLPTKHPPKEQCLVCHTLAKVAR